MAKNKAQAKEIDSQELLDLTSRLEELAPTHMNGDRNSKLIEALLIAIQLHKQHFNEQLARYQKLYQEFEQLKLAFAEAKSQRDSWYEEVNRLKDISAKIK